MTPNDIEVLIHCYVSTERHLRWHAPAVQESIARFLRDGLIYETVDGSYRTTESGAEMVKRLCNSKNTLVPEKIRAIEVHGDSVHYVMDGYTVKHTGAGRFKCMPLEPGLECQIKSALKNFEPGLATVERVERLHAKCSSHAKRINSLDAQVEQLNKQVSLRDARIRGLEERVMEIVEVTSTHVILKDGAGNRVHHPYAVKPEQHAWATAQATIHGLRKELESQTYTLKVRDATIKNKDAAIADQTSRIKELEAKLKIMQDGYDQLLKEHHSSDTIAKSFGKDLALVNIHSRAYIAVNETQVEAIQEYNK